MPHLNLIFLKDKPFKTWEEQKCKDGKIDLIKKKKTSYPIVQRLFAMQRYGGGMLYAALPSHMQRGCFRIRTHDQQVTKAQLYRCTRVRPQ